ncbi:Cellulose synthase catalytic subunit [UDP-forming] [Planctomycetales bacterium 10988]|nr:Cellulose synthase catalytic subunit [UDP-forming] [Planctomycetales bacterium 10988]
MQKQTRQFFILLALFSAAVYLVYRTFFTLNLVTWYSSFVSISLLAAEMYGIFLMSLYFFQVWDTDEPPQQPIPEGVKVDVYIPTYNEDEHLLRGTIVAAKAMDFPHKTYVLDDGNRENIKALAEEIGVDYIARADNLHAKAGNLNNALDITEGELIVIFDADHVAKKNFITRIIGYFNDPKMAFVQTPHSFYNFDNFQATLNFKKNEYWEEGQLFYNVVQPGKNRWNGVSFCGSAAMFRRSALEEVGLIATETNTEDMHTGLRLHAAGYNSLFINEPLIIGQAATDVTTFNSQRVRWGEGNLSIMAHDNPLTIRGLTLPQRLCYMGSMLSWTTGVPKLVLYVTPILMLFTGVAPVRKFTSTLGVITLFYLFSTWGAVKAAGNGYGNIWAIEVTAMANFWTQIRSTWRALVKRAQQSFVVTSKRGRQSNSLIKQIMPHILLIVASLAAVFWALIRYFYGFTHDLLGLSIGSGLVLVHVLLAFDVLRRSLKGRDFRFSYRHPSDTVHVHYRGLNILDTEEPLVGQAAAVDINECGLGLTAFEKIPSGTKLDLLLQGGGN